MLGNTRLMALKDNKGVSPLGDAKSQGHSLVVKYLESVGMRS